MDDTARQEKERGAWDRQAGVYDGRVLRTYKDAYDLSIEKVRAAAAPEQDVLEIGCGTGIVSLGVAACVHRLVATDLSPEMLAVARDKAARAGVSNVEFRVADGYALPYDDGSFDVVLVFNTLHVVQEPAAVLREAHRLLRPGGWLLSATDCYAEPVPIPVRLMLSLQKVLHWLGVLPLMWYFRKEEVERLLADSAFEVIEAEVLHAAPVNYYVRARRGGRRA